MFARNNEKYLHVVISMLLWRHEAECIREETWDNLPDGVPLVAKRPDHGLSEAFWDNHCDGRRGRGTCCEKGGDTSGDLCTGVLPQAARKPGSTSGKAGRLLCRQRLSSGPHCQRNWLWSQ